jgi:hypothetical protein
MEVSVFVLGTTGKYVSVVRYIGRESREGRGVNTASERGSWPKPKLPTKDADSPIITCPPAARRKGRQLQPVALVMKNSTSIEQEQNSHRPSAFPFLVILKANG